jgi:hypothetical protein
MKARRFFYLMATLLGAQLVFGCGTFGRNEALPEGRNVKTVTFPVRHLKYTDIECRQEYEHVELSGTITNASPYRLIDVGANVIIFFAETIPPHKITGHPTFPIPSTPSSGGAVKEISVTATPSVLLPADTATFEMSAEVDEPVARIEVHGVWTKSN